MNETRHMVSFRASDFAPDPHRPGWSRCAFPRGELRAQTDCLAELEELGLLDFERWRGEQLGGVTVNRKPDRWVRCIPGATRALYAKYRRGTRRVEWFEELLHGRRPVSAAAREERARDVLSGLGLTTAHIVLAGELCGPLGVERESLLVSEELVGFDPIQRLSWDRLAPGLRRLIGKLSDRRVAVPDLYAKHLFYRAGEGLFALVDLPRVEPSSGRSPLSLFVRHAGALVATCPDASAGEFADAWSESKSEAQSGAASGGDAGRVRALIERRADLVRVRKKIQPPASSDYGARKRYQSAEAVEAYRGRSSRRARSEAALVASLLPARIEGVVADAPCGAGRWSDLLREHGARPLCIDVSRAMASAAAHAGGDDSPVAAAVGELERLPLADASLAGAICFRFMHHLPTAAARAQVLGELARVAREFCIVSFFHPLSAHNVLRGTKARFARGGGPVRTTCSPGTLAREAAAAGWRLAEWRREGAWRDLWAARLERAR